MSPDYKEQPSFEDDRDVREWSPDPRNSIYATSSSTATVDEHLQKVGAETFNKFERYALVLPRLDRTHDAM